MSYQTLIDKSRWFRNQLFEMVVAQGMGHIPSGFSCTEVLIGLYYGGILRIDPTRPDDPGRDRFIVSKGHAAASLYPILGDLGFFPAAEVQRYTRPGALLGMYADIRVPGIESISGSLGHGLGLACGMALAGRHDRRDYRVVVLLGDGECYEGSIWESAFFPPHHRLDHVTVIVDRNRLCTLGRTDDLMDQGDLAAKWASFGWEAVEVDGHSYASLMPVLERIKRPGGKPLAIIANTIKGKGVSFMEGVNVWHNRMPSPEQAAQARKELAVNCISS
ncbi:MAG: transketolase [Magnetococcales bacterium]|nr:transketolase [Magnetococcales bacterium]